VLGLIAGITVPTVVHSVDTARTKAVKKEAIQMITQIIQEGYQSGDFSNISDWTLDSPSDPIVAYFTSKLGAITKQCIKGDIDPPCDKVSHGTSLPTHYYNDHSARWVFSNGTNFGLVANDGSQVNVGPNNILLDLNSKANDPNRGENHLSIWCNLSDATLSSYNGTPFKNALKPAQCGPWNDQDAFANLFN
jgi:type II secretory pathway pseudopilin PulG